MQEYKFSDDEFKLCKDFSEQVDTSFYATRSQFNVQKRIKDSLIGKLGELAVYNLLKDEIKDISYPDFKIYSAKEKSWDFDLKAKNCNLHVKCQDIEQGEKYGVSWIFQHGKYYDKEIFDQTSPNQYVAFVSVNLKEKTSLVRAIIKLELLHNKKLFALPKLERLQQANKLAVYLKDLEKYPDQLWQI